MNKKQFRVGVPFALEQLENERAVIESFGNDTAKDGVAYVTLIVNGVEHVIPVHDCNFKEFAKLLTEFNEREVLRLSSCNEMGSGEQSLLGNIESRLRKVLKIAAF